MNFASIKKRSYLRSIYKAIPMNKDFYGPTTREEAHCRIEEAERDIADGKVVPHEEVMRRACELLKGYGC